MEAYLSRVRLVTANAVVESFLEATLDAVEESLRNSVVLFSSEWLRDRRLREKMFLDLGEIVNLIPLRVLSRYCWKAMAMVENTAQDLCLSTFDFRLLRMKDDVVKIDKFLLHFREAQYLWYYLLHFVKFTARGELDRDSTRMYNNCTEDLKKMEMILGGQKSGNLLLAFQTAVEHDLNAEGLKNTLNLILEDVHSAIQSLLDACPRLSLISYNRLVGLFKAWLLGAHNDLVFVSSCICELFEGVGMLHTTTLTAQKQIVCTGFTSEHQIETVVFGEVIGFDRTLDEFVKAFEDSLRRVTEKSCDLLLLHRINCMKALLSDQNVETILENMQALHSIRLEQLKAMIHDDTLSSAYLLSNQCSFAEDVWTSLGHPSGCITVARPALLLESLSFSRNWRTSLSALQSVIRDNISSLQEWFLTPHAFPRTNYRKSLSLMSSFLGQEIALLQQLEELEACSCLESATELWAGKFQLRYEFDRTKRDRHCPFEVSVGNIAVPYGMEYQETGTVCRYCPELEYAIGRTLSSAFAFRGTIFVNSAAYLTAVDNCGEFQVSGKDIARALGRLCCTLSDASHVQNVRFFFARLIYLDAVGCVEFSTIDQASLEIFIQTAQSFWSAIEHKNDQYIQDSLKFPLKAKFSRNDLHGERRKQNLTNLRNTINTRKKDSTHLGLLFVGFASESEYTSLSVFDHFYRSIFDSVTMDTARALDNIGMFLTCSGFMYGAELQTSLITTLLHQMQRRSHGDLSVSLEVFQRLNNFVEVQRLVHTAAESLRLLRFSRMGASYASKNDRFALETLCFCANLWDRLLILSSGNHYLQSHTDFFREFVQKIDVLATAEQTQLLQEMTQAHCPRVLQSINLGVLFAAQRKGYLASHDFVQSSALLWEGLSWHESPVLVLTGTIVLSFVVTVSSS